MNVAAARIGPNAITRTLEALRECLGDRSATEVLRHAGLERYALQPPAAMVPEDDVVALYGAVRARLDARAGDAAARLAGRKTAEYLLAHRIPRAVQTLLRRLPPALAAPLLLAAITRHTWTFAGSGTVAIRRGRPPCIAIAHCPICRGATGDDAACGYYAATFERLFTELVSARATVEEIACEALGAAACTFALRY